jgi:hypothetical protein
MLFNLSSSSGRVYNEVKTMEYTLVTLYLTRNRNWSQEKV